jgi:hypothetical protein
MHRAVVIITMPYYTRSVNLTIFCLVHACADL